MFLSDREKDRENARGGKRESQRKIAGAREEEVERTHLHNKQTYRVMGGFGCANAYSLIQTACTLFHWH